MRTETNVQTGEVTEHVDAPITYIPPTAQEIDDAKTAQADATIKAFALVVLDEINILRVNAGLQPRTVAQLKSAVKAKL